MARRGRHTVLLAASLLWLATAAVQLRAADSSSPTRPLTGEGDLSREVPDTTIFYLHASGFAPLREPFQSTALNAIWQEPEVQNFLAKPLADFKARIEAGTSAWPLLWPEVCDLLDGPAAFAVLPGAGEEAEPAAVLLARPRDLAAFQAAFQKIVKAARAGKLPQTPLEAVGSLIAEEGRGLPEARTEARTANCRANLKMLGLALALYANDHKDALPPTLRDLIPDYVPDETLFHCPSASPQTAQYLYVPGLTMKAPKDAIVAFERTGNHEGGRNVLFLDGHVEFLNEEAFNQKLAAQANAEAIRKLDGAQMPQQAPAPAAKAAPAPAAPPATYTIGSVTVTLLTDAPDSPAYCYLDGLFVLGMEKGHLEAYLTWRSAPGRTALSSAKEYQSLEAKLQPTGAALLAYLNVPGVLKATTSEMTEEERKTFTALGFDSLDWLGATVTCDPPGWRTRLFLAWHGEPTGLIGLLPATAVPEDLLALAPKVSLAAAALNLNAAEFYDRLRTVVGAVSEESGASFEESMAAFAAEVGFDLRQGLLAPLGHEFLLYVMRTPLSPFGFDVALVVRGTDEKKLGPTLDLLVAYLHKQFEAQGEGKVETLDVDGHALYSLRFGRYGPPFAPSFAVVPNFAVASLFPGSARAAIVAVTAAQPQPELSLSASDTFKAVRAKVPASGSFLSYVDPSQGFEALYPGLVTMFTMFGQQLPFDLSLLPQPQTISKHLGGALSVVRVEPQGLFMEAYSPTIIPVGFLPLPPAVGAAILLPGLSGARDRGPRDTVCRSNLKQIGLAMAIYANDHGDKFPPALKDLMPDYLMDEGILHCPSDSSKEPSYFYVPGVKFGAGPTVMVVIERGGIHPGGRGVLFADWHVEWMDEGAFQARWARQQQDLKLPTLKELGDTVEEKQAAPAGSTKEKE